MRKTFCLLAALLLVSLTACQKELAEEDLIYRGDWDSKNYAIQIYRNGYGMVNSKKMGVSLQLEGRVSIKDDRIIFTSNLDTSTLPRKRFQINEKPTIDANGITYMVLDNERFERR